LSPKLSTFKAPLRYFVVAACGFCVDFSIYATFVAMGVSVYWANAAGFCVGAIVNVILIRAFVFPDSRFRLGQDVLLTVSANGAMLGLGMGVLWILVDALHLNPYWAKLFTNGVTFVLNYVTRAAFFRKQ
jgi:putative flippase GtrA